MLGRKAARIEELEGEIIKREDDVRGWMDMWKDERATRIEAEEKCRRSKSA